MVSLKFRADNARGNWVEFENLSEHDFKTNGENVYHLATQPPPSTTPLAEYQRIALHMSHEKDIIERQAKMQLMEDFVRTFTSLRHLHIYWETGDA